MKLRSRKPEEIEDIAHTWLNSRGVLNSDNTLSAYFGELSRACVISLAPVSRVELRRRILTIADVLPNIPTADELDEIIDQLLNLGDIAIVSEEDENEREVHVVRPLPSVIVRIGESRFLLTGAESFDVVNHRFGNRLQMVSTGLLRYLEPLSEDDLQIADLLRIRSIDATEWMKSPVEVKSAHLLIGQYEEKLDSDWVQSLSGETETHIVSRNAKQSASFLSRRLLVDPNKSIKEPDGVYVAKVAARFTSQYFAVRVETRDKKVIVSKAVKLPILGEKTAWDAACLLQYALDAEANRASYQITSEPKSNKSTLRFNLPLPSWIERYLAIVGTSESGFKYTVDNKDLESVRIFLEKQIWAKEHQ